MVTALAARLPIGQSGSEPWAGVLCCLGAKHFTLTVLFSTQVFLKSVTANLILGAYPQRTNIPSTKGGGELYPLSGDKCRPDSPFGSYTELTFSPFSLYFARKYPTRVVSVSAFVFFITINCENNS